MRLQLNIILGVLLGLCQLAYAQDIYNNSTNPNLYGIGNPTSNNQSDQDSVATDINNEEKSAQRRQTQLAKYQKQQKDFLISSLVVGIAGGGGGIVTGASMFGLAAKMEQRIANPQKTDSQIYISELQTASKQNRVVGAVALGIGGAAAVTAVVLGVLQVNAKHKVQKLQVAILPDVSVDKKSLTVSLQF